MTLSAENVIRHPVVELVTHLELLLISQHGSQAPP